MNWHGPDDWQDDLPQDDGWSDEDAIRWPLTWRGPAPPGAVAVVRAAVGRRVRPPGALSARRCARGGGRTTSRSRRSPRSRRGPSATTPASGTTRPGKLALLFDIERVAALLRDGVDPFHPDRDRTAFVRHLIDLGCQPPPSRRPVE